ncbi:hypothetical protein NQ318_020840, partial [Aromia moschata]
MTESEPALTENEDELEEEPEALSRELENKLWIRDLVKSEGIYESPVDINITNTKPIEIPPLEWNNFDVPPKKIKINNTGHTIIFSAKWGQERPHLTGGPLFGKYVFSNWHLHWGVTDMEGSEHTVDGGRQPAEMHVLQDAPNSAFQHIVDALYDIQKAGTGKKIDPQALTDLIGTFESDYFMYWGT